MPSETSARPEGYDGKFFGEVTTGSLSSAGVIVPLLISLLKPGSVLDVGCAEGAWLSVFDALGLRDYHGIDGPYVDRKRLLIDAKKFTASNLEADFSLGRTFDLAICLEVAEHLSQAAAAKLVGSLVAHSNCIAFSASVPYQDGTLHINEQWPAYWAELFRQRGYAAYDCLRARVWNDPKVCWWFAQNIIIYATPQFAVANPGLGEPTLVPLPMVHPQLLLHKENRLSLHKALLSQHDYLVKKCQSPRWLFKKAFQAAFSRRKSG